MPVEQKSSVLESIRAKLSQLNSNSQRRILIWRPESGVEAQIRIVPYKHAADPFNEMYFHYGVGNVKSVICPQMTFGGAERCPICEYLVQLRQQPKTEKVVGVLKRLSPKFRGYVPVIIRNREAEGVRFWGFGQKVYKTIAALFVDADYGDISDVLKGRDLKVLSTPPNSQAMFGEVLVRPVANSSRLHESIDQMKEWVNNCPKVTEAFEPLSYDVISKTLDEFINADEAAAQLSGGNNQEESEDETKTPTPSVDSAKTPFVVEVAEVEDIDAMFDNLGNLQ